MGVRWNIDRLNQVKLPLDGNTRFQSTNGKSARLYMIDTGCHASHQEFGGRATAISVTYQGSPAYPSGDDQHGHGTHTAATAGGATVGVAREARIICIKTLDDQGSAPTSYIVAALDMVRAAKAANPSIPMVASLSLGGSVDLTLNSAVARLTRTGVVVVVAAGNDNSDAANYSPASAGSAITVGATGNYDRRDSRYSNYGSVVDMYAPGTNVYSAFYTSDSAYATMTGTSMATPLVAGTVASMLSAARPCMNLISKLSNPLVRVAQPSGYLSKPLVYLASNSSITC